MQLNANDEEPLFELICIDLVFMCNTMQMTKNQLLELICIDFVTNWEFLLLFSFLVVKTAKFIRQFEKQAITLVENTK